ncbi:Phage Mu protein F like protein [compost metagenome]
MRSADYWAKRMEVLNEALLSRGDSYAADMKKEYQKALARITADTERWYGRLAANNEVSLADAKKLLTKGELKEFKWTVEEYIERGRENAIDQRWAKQLENASAKAHITRLEQIQMQIQNEVEQLAGRQQKGVTGLLGETYKDGYYHSVYELEKGKGFGTGFAKLDAGQIDKTLAKPWAPDGRNFSSRIWTDRTKLNNELQTTLTQSLINGSNSDKVIKDFAERMGVAESSARRLILTEAAYFAGQSRMDAYRETGVKEYEFVATLDSRTSVICREMDGERIKVSDAQPGVNYPPVHTYCRSTTVPVVEDAEPGGSERAARKEDGGYYTVPEDTTYPDWAAKHAPEATEQVHAPEPPKAVDPPEVTTVEPPSDVIEPEVWEQPGVDEPNSGVNRKYNPRAGYYPELSGVTEKVLDKLAEVNRGIVRTGYKEARETLVLMNKDTGDELHRLSGSINKVTFTAELDQKLRGASPRSVILTHNHPRGTRVNIKDALNLAVYPSLHSIVAAGHNGGISYVIADTAADEVMFFKTLEAVRLEVYELLQKDKKYATLSKTAQAEYFDYRVLIRLVQELGWMYGEDFSAAKRDPRI